MMSEVPLYMHVFSAAVVKRWLQEVKAEEENAAVLLLHQQPDVNFIQVLEKVYRSREIN